MRHPALTVLTNPIPTTAARLYASLRGAARDVLYPNRPRPAASPYPGHGALVRSVVEGLRAIGADFNFNPRRFSALGDIVYAPANEALRQAAELKRKGVIRRLVAGPVNAFFPTECDGILLMPEIDTLIVASEWVRELYASVAPDISSKVRVCRAGVDPDYWKPDVAERGRRAVVYRKSGSEAFWQDVEGAVEQVGLEPIRIAYGEYDRASYKQALSTSIACVFLSDFETQGLALAEAWAMDVPTVVWDPQGPTEWKGDAFIAGSSCPYLTAATGRAWRTLPELDAALGDVVRAPESFSPRAWVLAHMTDAICAQALYGILLQSGGDR